MRTEQIASSLSERLHGQTRQQKKRGQKPRFLKRLDLKRHHWPKDEFSSSAGMQREYLSHASSARAFSWC